MSPFDEIWLGSLTELVALRLRNEDDNAALGAGPAARLRDRVEEVGIGNGGGLDDEEVPIMGFEDLRPAFRLTPRVLAFCHGGVPPASTGTQWRRKSGS